MKRIILTLVLSVLSVGANAALIDRGDGFIYDDVLNTTWVQTPGTLKSSYFSLNIWVAGYSQTHSAYGTFNDWRMPNMDRNGDGSIVRYGCAGNEVACRDNELAYMYHHNGITHANMGPFLSSSEDWPGTYWASTIATCCGGRYYYNFSVGDEGASLDHSSIPSTWHRAWAVRSGDIAPASAVPIPAAVWLFGSGLGLLGWVRRKAS